MPPGVRPYTGEVHPRFTDLDSFEPDFRPDGRYPEGDGPHDHRRRLAIATCSRGDVHGGCHLQKVYGMFRFKMVIQPLRSASSYW